MSGDALACAGGCGLLYSDPGWCDAIIPTDVWVQISPRGDEGGVMCLTCTARALVALGLSDVPMVVTSGPWRYRADHTIESPLPLRPPGDALDGGPEAGNGGGLAAREAMCICAEIANEVGFRLSDDQIKAICDIHVDQLRDLIAAREAAAEQRGAARAERNYRRLLAAQVEEAEAAEQRGRETGYALGARVGYRAALECADHQPRETRDHP